MNDVSQIIAPYRDQTGGTISALRAIVESQGHIDEAAQQAVARLFNISNAEVRGIVSFYSDLRTTRPANTVIRLCQAEACQAVGCRQLGRELEDRLGIATGESTADGRVGIESVYCLGLCANGPAVMVGEALVAEADLETIMERLP